MQQSDSGVLKMSAIHKVSTLFWATPYTEYGHPLLNYEPEENRKADTQTEEGNA